jgi:hypothetical protein
MGVVAIGAVRSCGATTLALALAATWPAERRVLLIEADPAGGTLAAGSGWPSEPSLVSLAAAARRAFDPDLIWAHCHKLPGGASVVAGPAPADQAQNALSMLGDLSARLGELDADVLVDCGRLDRGSPALPIVGGADRAVLAVRPRLADLHALAAWAEGHIPEGNQPGLVTIGDGPYPDTEIAEAVGLEVLGRLPWEPDAAQALLADPASARPLRMAPLVRAARTLADRLTAAVGARAEAPLEVRGPARGRSPLAMSRRLVRTWRPDVSAASNGNSPRGPVT